MPLPEPHVMSPRPAARGWRQDYWVLKMLNEGLDPYEPGGPADGRVSLAKICRHLQSFDGLHARLITVNWEIVVDRVDERARSWKLVPVHGVDPSRHGVVPLERG